jgi:hypothetical protein
MNKEMKTANQVGKMVWKSFGFDSVKILNVSLAEAMINQNTTHKIAQITCKVESREVLLRSQS